MRQGAVGTTEFLSESSLPGDEWQPSLRDSLVGRLFPALKRWAIGSRSSGAILTQIEVARARAVVNFARRWKQLDEVKLTRLVESLHPQGTSKA